MKRIVLCTLLAGALAATGALPAVAAPRSPEARVVVAAARQVFREQRLAGLIVRVDRGRREVVSAALGETMTGVPATTDMRFRIGSMAIPYLTTILLQLQEEGELDLDDPLEQHLPGSGVPNADRVTLRMLGHSISGYPDWIQRNPPFAALVTAEPFRLWSEQELLDAAFAQPLTCEPGACFSYAHTNFLLLGRVVSAVTGEPFAKLVRQRIFRPLGLRQTTITRTALIPEPALHAYGTGRGVYEDQTSFSPSWGLGNGQLMVSTAADVVATARGVLGGELLKPRSYGQLVSRPTVIRIPVPGLSYGLGVLLAGDWLVQNPYINDYGGVMAYLPDEQLAISIVSTKGPQADFAGGNASELLLQRLAEVLTPEHPVHLPSTG